MLLQRGSCVYILHNPEKLPLFELITDDTITVFSFWVLGES